MQWNQLKTLFILCFLVLDVYLLILFFNQQQESESTKTAPTAELSIEERMQEEKIEIKTDLPDEEIEESYITVKQKRFSEEEKELLMKKENLESAVAAKDLIVSRYEDPVPIPKDASKETINGLLKDTFLLPENYEYWDWNEEMNVLVFFQKKSGRPIYYNHNGIILVFLNDDNEAIFYTQTMLGDAVSSENEQSEIKPMLAIQQLLNDNRLESGDEITGINLGYYTFYPLPSGEQVFAPTWTITVNEEKNFYVNAMETLVIPSDELGFLTETAADIMNKVQTLEENTKLETFVINHLSEKLTTINRSETE
ncbi:two-component system regulatory protein YycI [Virgibacillus kekensis]|uniref:Two-component system regulatory protein YycI n=1 Tax=Virgibacillus kekensis TaxID=202261 RepID=A0ABV9DJ92_9BACI